MPHQVVTVPRSTTNRMPHVIVGAPNTDPFRWILGFEDLTGGGDRDFNDVVFQINKSNGGTVTSGIVSGDISPTDVQDFTITNVRFKKDDNLLFQASGPANSCPAPRPRASPTGWRWTARFARAGVCTANPNPSWTQVPLPPGNPSEVTFNVLNLGFTGSQLCWQARLASPNQYCQPTINSISVGYQAVRSGSTRAPASPPWAMPSSSGPTRRRDRSWTGPWPG